MGCSRSLSIIDTVQAMAGKGSLGKHSGGAITGKGPFLLKVPKWLSETWNQMPSEALVADLDLEAGKLKLLAGGNSKCPDSMSVECRSSPGLFAFSQGSHGCEELCVDGTINEVLHVKADLQNVAYQGMLQRRVEEAA